MAAKQALLEAMCAGGLVLPDCIGRGLAAYDRVKYYLALLQAAQARAHAPEHPAADLRDQRESSGIADASLDRIVEESVSRGNGTTYVPAACAILESMFDSLKYMAATIELASGVREDLRERSLLYRRRLEALATTIQGCKDDQITNVTIKALTSQTRNGHDTVHQLTTDMHAELDRLQATVATETIDGARAFGVADGDRPLVRAFMAGVHETEGLKFSHPGLNTTVAGDGVRLSIQNTLGSTPAHLIVVHVEQRVATITYTDEHPRRLRFFQGLFDGYAIGWTSTSASDDASIVASVGKYIAETTADLERFLHFLGSRLVFLIDWNRARKRLSRLVSKGAAVDLLRWAADNNIGHRGFLEAGDLGVIETAFERAVPVQTRFGLRLDELLGAQAARQFLMAVLRTASWAIATGQSARLIEDEVEAELLRHLDTPERHGFAAAAQQAKTIVLLIERVRHALARVRADADDSGHGHGNGLQTAALAQTLTSRPDAVLLREFKPLFTEAAGAVAALEDSAFVLPLIPRATEPSLLSLVQTLADHVDATARAYLRCLEEGRDLSRFSDRADMDNFLVTIDRLAAVGRDASAARRTLTERLMRSAADCRQFYAVTTLADRLEDAAARVSRCGAFVRDRVLPARLVR